MKAKQKMDVQAVIFDFDNTLVNTRQAIENAYKDIFADMSEKYKVDKGALWSEIIRIEQEKVHNPDKTKNNYHRRAWFKIMAKNLNIKFSKKDLDRYLDMFYSSIKNNIEFSEHTENVLKTIKSSGRKLALLTERDDSMPGFKQERIKHLSFSKHFDVIVVAGETVPERKLETAAFSKTAEMLGTEPEKILMIGDRLDIDIENGKEAGFRTALINSYDDPRIGKYTPDYVISDIREVLKLI